MASIGWIDFSTNDRNRVGSVLDLLKPEGMVDELGIGTIRDAIANQLFPGISTIQTRAKYFFIVPYILNDYQTANKSRLRGKLPSKYLEEKEYEIMWELAEKYEHKEGSGVIGISKRKPNKIVRRPSAIYWNGLQTYKFIDTKGLSIDVFLKQSANGVFDSLLSDIKTGDDTTGDDVDADFDNKLKIKVPYHQKWADNLDLPLLKEEADFFQDRIISTAKGKLIAELLKNQKLWNLYNKSESFMEFAKAAVSLPLPNRIKDMLVLAHDFSEIVYGAHIAYNSQLQQEVFNNDYYADEFDNWISNIKNEMLDFKNFNPDILPTYATTTRQSTMQFIKTWWEHTQSGFPNLRKRDTLIREQESMVKTNKARLVWKKTDDVREGEWLGLRHFAYRFPQGKAILTDIKEGCKIDVTS